MKAGKKLSEGSFGCVVTPAYKCNTNINVNKHVSKILKRPPPDNSEIQMGKILKKIDPKNKHFIYVDEHCTIKMNDISWEDQKKCKLDKKPTFQNYILKKGGNDLGDINIDVKTATKFTKQLLVSLKKLVNNNLINLDIKRPNVITDHNQKNAYIIDFGSDFVFKSFSSFFGNFFLHFDFNFIRFRWGTYIWAPEIFRSLQNYNGSRANIKPYGYDDKDFGIPKQVVEFTNKYVSELTPKKWKKYSEKVMIYSLGLALTKLLNENVINTQKDAQKLQKLRKIINGMTILNPYQRYSIGQSLRLLKNPKKQIPIILKSPIKLKKVNKSSPPTIKNAKKNKKKQTQSEICKQFLKNTKINPMTNRKIKHNGPTYKKLIKLCNNI